MYDIILLDADSLYFRTCFVTKKTNEIRKGIKHSLANIRRECMTDNMLLAVKGHDNFRNSLYSKYKANRKPLEDDMKKALTYAHEYLVGDLGAVKADGMEADDLCSIWAYEAKEMNKNYIVSGIDKDLLQIPGNHYNFSKKTFTNMSESEAHKHLMLQCLTGDNADNIPGIKGIGPKKAEKVLHDIPKMRQWSRVQAAWRKHKAGNPFLSRRLLEMLKSWSEYEDVRNKIEGKSSVSEQDVLAREESKD